jgi:hypothetical protein
VKQTEITQKELRQPGNHAAMTTPHKDRFAAKKDKKQ